jgi:hypothetical protein
MEVLNARDGAGVGMWGAREGILSRLKIAGLPTPDFG